ncbi:HSP20-like chaperone [Dacryopinax primogenitus]|uniref:HSP20-like chaperone n=1 Tax=Dacryopinax primogenitus (strain DJM 731) TaxID=1858805 RepID=M5GG11_DACPD|nr:HSP20-like chaperone [Dacryopinax primogenitus]EJU04678.1 HSP20-like chaperone [Dacryopinax primogenitus]
MSLIRSFFNEPFFGDEFLTRRGRQDPFDSLWRQQQQLSHAIDQEIQRSGFPVLRTPPCHVTEEKGEYVVEAELPGVRKEDLDVRITEGGRTLTIEGHTFRRTATAPEPQATISEHKEEKGKATTKAVSAPAGGKEVAKTEEEQTYQSTFTRSFTFPKAVDGAKISAKFENGLLTLQLPQLANPQEHKVLIA